MRQERGTGERGTGGPASAWRPTLSAACASLVGIGLARFGYTPLLPAIIAAHWFAPAAAAYLGAANLAGYLAGALLGRPLAARIGTPALLRGLMAVATLSFFGCATPNLFGYAVSLSLPWFFGWRLLSGISGGALMVLAAPAVLPHVPPGRRGLASGAIFAGVGLGIAASGTLLPLLLRGGVAAAWVGLGVVSAALTALAWSGWPAGAPAPAAAVPAIAVPDAMPGTVPDAIPDAVPRPALRRLYVAYALNAVGLVPHMLFLVDFVARGLHRGIDAGARSWVLFGLGAVLGPVLNGQLADRVGFAAALRLGFLVQIAAVLVPVASTAPAALAVSALVVGAYTPGIVPLLLGRIGELLPGEPARQRAAWSMATTAFALAQAGGAYALTFVLTRSGGDFKPLFGIAAAALALALLLDLAGARGARLRPTAPAAAASAGAAVRPR